MEYNWLSEEESKKKIFDILVKKYKLFAEEDVYIWDQEDWIKAAKATQAIIDEEFKREQKINAIFDEGKKKYEDSMKFLSGYDALVKTLEDSVDDLSEEELLDLANKTSVLLPGLIAGLTNIVGEDNMKAILTDDIDESFIKKELKKIIDPEIVDKLYEEAAKGS
jgi:hypothetical protein